MKNNIINRYKFIFKQVYNSGKLIFLISLISVVISGISPIATSYVFKKIIDAINYIFQIGSLEQIHFAIQLVIFYIAIIIVQDVTLIARTISYRICGISLVFNIQNLLVQKINKIHYEKLYSPKFQDEYSNILTNSQQEPLQIVTTLFTISSLLIQFLSSAFILCKFNFIIFLITVICLIPNIISKLKLQSNYVAIWDQQIKNYRKMNYFFDISTSKTFLKEIRLYNLIDHFAQKRKDHYTTIINIWNKFSKKEFSRTVFTQIIAYAGMGGSVIWLLFETVSRNFTVSDFIFYWGIVFSLQSVCLNLVSNVSSNYKSMLFIKKLVDFLYSKDEINFGKTSISENISHTFEFKDVSFAYEGSARTALKNINLKISSGEKICIVGENGCGKTTLINLLLRNLLPTQGEIILDDKNINSYTNKEYSNLFSCVYQDWQKYVVTLKEYVGLGNLKNSHNQEEIEIATKKSTANNFINKLRGKYESTLTRMFDTEGEELSIGQWQKLAVARTFFSNSNVFIFDEPTSAVDALSEAEIYKNIEEFPSNKIVILISHRMYAPKKADKIVFMKEGSIVDVGSHNELIERCDGYAKLFNTQAQGYK